MRGSDLETSRRDSNAWPRRGEYYVTFHHKGVIEGRETFVGRSTRSRVIDRRHLAMLDLPRRAATIAGMCATA